MDKKSSEFDKVFSAWDILVIAFGAMIGWGWVVSTGDWIGTAGVIGAMLGFVLGGIMIFFIGMTYAELTPAMPECGGEHVFSMRAMGPTGSFVCTWAIILGYVSVVCFEACALPTIITYIFPSFLQGYLYTVAGFDIYASWLAVAIVFAIFITVVNIVGAKTAAILQTILTVIIGAAGILLIVASVITGSTSNLDGQVLVGSGMKDMMGNIIKVAAVSPFFFIGFDVIPQAAEEINVPLKKIGKMLILSIILGITFYALVILAVGLVLNPEGIAASVASSAGLVTADAMAAAFHSSAMSKVLIVAGMCGILTSWNSFMIGGSRAMYSMAESYMIPRVFKTLHPKYKTPIYAILLIGLLSVLAPFAGRSMLVWIVDAGNFGCVAAYCMVSISFCILRKKEPNMPRPYKVKNGMLVGGLAVLLSGIMVLLYIIPGSGVTLAREEWYMTGGWYGLGVIFYIYAKAKYGKDFGKYEMVFNSELEGHREEQETEKPSYGSIEDALSAKEAIGMVEPKKEFSYYLPVNVHFGKGKVNEVGTLAKPYGKHVLIVTGGSSAKKSGLYDRVKALLEKEGMTTVLFDKVKPNPLTTTAEEGALLARKEKIDCVVAIGGGSIMDCAKGIAFLALNDGDISDYIYNRKYSDKALPLILIPTTCGTGSEGNGFAVLTNPENGDKKSLRCPAIFAKASIVDPDVMKTMPKSVLASVGFDALCHCMEAYTAHNAQPFTDAMCLYAIPLIYKSVRALYQGNLSESEEEQAWADLSLGATIGGMVINTAGVTLAHGMEHPVSGLKDIAHGKGLAAITPIAIEAQYKYNRPKFGRLARIFGGYVAEDCAPKIRSLLKDLDLELTLTDFGIEEKDLDWLTDSCLKVSAGNLVNTPGEPSREDIYSLYQQMM